MNAKEDSEKAKRSIWRRLAVWIGGIVAALALLFVIVCALIVWILTPSRLTPLVEKHASEYLRADVKVERVELTFWKTFPRMRVDVDSLRIISRTLADLPAGERALLPADADSLLSLGHFHGGINALKLLGGKISLHDVRIERLSANLLQVNDSTSNYMIFPPSESTDTSAVSIPPVSINSFTIVNAGPLRYRSIPDSMDVSVMMRNVNLADADTPRYRLEISGNADVPMLREFALQQLTFGLDGNISWDSAEPYIVEASDVRVSVDEYAMTFSTAFDMGDNPRVTSLTASIDGLPVESALSHVPEELRPMTAPLKTDMRLSATATLLRPWELADTMLPAARLTFDIPRCRAAYQTWDLSELAASVAVDFDGAEIDNSVVTINNLHARGEGVEVDLSATATRLLSDPYIDGRFRGSVNLAKIPPQLAQMIPVQLSGTVDGDAAFRLAMSELNRDNFHRIYADGSLNLRNINAQATGLLTAQLHHGRVEFGTSDSFVRDGYKVDSLLRLSLNIDTLSANGMGMNLEVKDFKAGVGAANRSSSADTAEINPFGGRINIGRLKFISTADTMRVSLRNASIGGALRRFRGNARSPQMDLRVGAGRMMFGQGLNRFSLTDTDLGLTVHMRDRDRTTTRGSVSPAERAMRQALRDAADSAAVAAGNIPITLDRKDRRLLRRWDFNGHLNAKSGRVVTPYLPLRNRLRHIDLRFNSDSIVLSSLRYQAGQSDFTINGTISNLRGALTSRSNNVLGLELSVSSDTINVNEIVKAIFAGQSIANQTSESDVWTDDDGDAASAHLAQMADTVSTGPVLIPRNIDAHLRMRANHVLYSDLVLHRFRGNLLVMDGALNLRNLSASTDVGSVAINGLYSSANVDSLQFGLGMKVDRLKLDRLTSLVPAIDTLLPAMRDFAGLVNADIAVTTDLYRNMDINIPTLRAAIKIEGDSLVLLDPDTFKTVSKWLLFKNKKKNMIDHMAVEVLVENSTIELFPFMFDIDRYRLGVMGHNDLAMNLNYHVSVLKSPIPFRFGINLKGTPEKLKVRLGGAKVKADMVGERQTIANDTRVNLVEQIDRVFRRGVDKARHGRLRFPDNTDATRASLRRMQQEMDREETMTHADSLNLISAGVLEAPDSIMAAEAAALTPTPLPSK